MSRTLTGVRMLDLTRMLAGPYATMLLADMGAEVVKVEDPRGGDPIREMGPPFVEGVSAYFLAINRNKKSVTLDLKSPRGRDVFLQLVAVSDVVVDNFRPGVTDRLGIGPEACRSARSDVVTCAIPGMTKPQHAQDNLGAARGRLPNEAMRRRMEQLLAEL